MTAIRNFIKGHPLQTYFALAFTLSWAGVLLVIGGPGGIPGTTEQAGRLFPLAFLAMLVGPSVASILLTAIVSGKGGLREFLSRLLRWRVGARWYVVALATAPLLTVATFFVFSLLSPGFLPGKSPVAGSAPPPCCSVSPWGWGRASSRNWAGRGSPCPGFGNVMDSLLPVSLWASSGEPGTFS